MKYSKKKYLEYLSENIESKDLAFMDDFVKIDKFSVRQVKAVFDTNTVPSKAHSDFCFYISEYFFDWEDGNALGDDYVFVYMGSLFLYCASKLGGDYSPEVASRYVRRIIQILKKYDDIEGARYFYRFLSSISSSYSHFDYFLTIGKLFLMRAFGIRLQEADIVNEEVRILLESLKGSSLSYLSDSIECPVEYMRLNKELPIPEELKHVDFDDILLPVD